MTDLAKLASDIQNSGFDTTFLPDGSAVMLDLTGHRILTLSPTAAFVVSMLRDGVYEVHEHIQSITEHFDVGRSLATADLEHFLTELERVLDERNERT
jgi:hypothetical protein